MRDDILPGLTNFFLIAICRKFQARFPSACFLGVYPRNSLPVHPRAGFRDGKCYFFIANTDPDNLPGRHWIAIWVGASPIGISGRVGEYFDPLGLHPLPEFSRWLTLRCGTAWTFTRFSVQHPLSAHCGVWVLFYLYFKLCEGARLLNFILLVLSRHPRGVGSFRAAYHALRLFQLRVLFPLMR